MNEAIQAEVDRLKAGPQSGWFTFLHHEGPIAEKSANVMERVGYILREKAKNESPEKILARLQHIYPMPTDLRGDYEAQWKVLDGDYWAKWELLRGDYDAKWNALGGDYWAKWKLLRDDYEAKRELLRADYEAKRELLRGDYDAKREVLDDNIPALIPNCKWNGETIFG